MKKTLLLLSLLFAGIMQAQIVNIPDANFKNYLLSSNLASTFIIDTNDDGEIQISEALAVTTLQIFEYPEITGIFDSFEGLEAFTNLNYLHVITNGTTNLDLSVLTLLENIVIQSNLGSVDLSGLSNLLYVKIDSTHLTSLNLTGLDNLVRLEIDNAPISTLDVSELSNLALVHLSNLHYLTSFNVGNNNELNYIFVNDINVTTLDLSGCPNLESLQLMLNNEDSDVYVNLKNGNSSYASNNPPAIYLTDSDGGNGSVYNCFLCLDEGEIGNFQYIDPNILISTYCTFTPGGDYNVITGSLLFDNEGDGCDSNDTVISNIKLNINDGTESGSTISSTGVYSFYTQSGTFTVTPDFESDYFTITPPFAEINFTEVDSLVTTQNFCLTPNGNHPDLDIVIVPFGARPGFDADYKIIYRNKGNQTLSGDIVFNYEEDVLDFVLANPPQDSSTSGTLTWNYTNLSPFQQREIFVTLNVNGPMETPPVNIDDNLQFTATINPVAGDDTQFDNVFGLKQTVIGSFDPNDITCLEGDSVNPDKIGDYLHYNINFENTGTAPATFIVVKDVINTAQFDMATLQMLNASHPVQAKITGNKVEFRFDDINLGPEGKGNVVFKIKTLNTLQANDDVTQQADIFFDYNWPIQTNEATTVFEVLSRSEFERDNSVKVYPNPSNGMVNITAASEIRSVELYDIQGRLLQAGSSASLDISGRAAGMYFVKVLTENGMKVEKIVRE